MKYNLKNRPKKEAVTEDYTSDLQCFYEYTLEWFVGFERELREMLIVNAVMPTVDEKKYGAYCVIREMLGK